MSDVYMTLWPHSGSSISPPADVSSTLPVNEGTEKVDDIEKHWVLEEAENTSFLFSI